MSGWRHGRLTTAGDASAFHVRWRSPSNGLISPALSVADEPEPFWDGTGHDAVLHRVAEQVPAAAGHIRDAGDNNGRAGRTLKNDYLHLLGLL